MKRSPSRAFSPLLCTLMALAAACASAAPRESWLGVYFNSRKIGYASTRIEEASYRGKQAFRILSTALTRMELLGTSVSQDVRSVTHTDSSYRPLHQEYTLRSNNSTVHLEADYQPGKIVCTVDAGGGPTRREVVVPPGANLIMDSSNVTQGKTVTVGQKATYYYLNPLTISLEKTDVTVQGEDQVRLAGHPYAALRVLATTPIGPMTSWTTADGDMLKGEMPLGMAMFKETAEVAQNMSSPLPVFSVTGAAAKVSAYTPPSDFAIATAIKTDRPILNPRKVRALTLVVSGVDDRSRLISDRRQQESPVPAQPDAVRIHVTAGVFDTAQSVRLPVRDPAVQPYLKSAPYLETGDPDIRRIATEIKGRETNAGVIAGKVRDWVHRVMTPDYSIGVPRSCVEVFKRRRGVCRDYATLFAGIARAAGVPTRLAAGIVYAEGRFFYHAWAECWVGEWVAYDPTLGTDFVDATHIKFAQGDVTGMFSVVNIVGRIHVSVVDVQ